MAVAPPNLKEYKLKGQNAEKAREWLLSKHERERGNKVQQLSDGTVRLNNVPPLAVVEFLNRR